MKQQKDLIEILSKTGLVPLFAHEDVEMAQRMVEAAYNGGARVVEFTNRKGNAREVFSKLAVDRAHYAGLRLGVGTVMDAVATQQFIDEGADFIISPIMKPAMADVCHRNKIPWIPGCATLTEIVTAHELGASMIKVFPGSVLGSAFVSSILPVVPDLKLMITGGVEREESSLRQWFGAGALCVGLGSQLFRTDLLEAKAWDKLRENISDTISILRKIKSQHTS